jgi:glycosyltransferase involved in cell wall biosynthesis
MRVAIDVRAADGPPTGICSHVRTLVAALAATQDDNRYLLLRHAPSPRRPLAADPRFEEMMIPAATDLWLECNLHPILEQWDADLYHTPLAPVVRSCPAAMTIHDIIPRVMPEVVDERFRQYFDARIAPGLRQCDHLIAVSEHTARDVATFYGLSPSKISVVPQAAPPEHIGSVDSMAVNLVLAEARARRPYFLFVGALEPRKNVSRLLDAFAILCAESERHIQLVIVGAPRDKADELDRRLRAADREGNIVRLESATPEQLRAFYRSALAFVFPSLYEGFGLPVLEAMSHGVPVIVARVSALPELVSDGAGLLIDPYDPRELAEAMKRVACDDRLRESLSRSAKARAAEFSLQRMGERTVDAYRRAVTG